MVAEEGEVMAEKGTVEESLDQCAGALSIAAELHYCDEAKDVSKAVLHLLRAVRAINERLGVVVVESGPRRTTCRLDLLPDYHREALATIGILEGRIREALFSLKNATGIGLTVPMVFEAISEAIAHLEGAHDVE